MGAIGLNVLLLIQIWICKMPFAIFAYENV